MSHLLRQIPFALIYGVRDQRNFRACLYINIKLGAPLETPELLLLARAKGVLYPVPYNKIVNRKYHLRYVLMLTIF